jgi:tellurite resistance protein TehA-like permease
MTRFRPPIVPAAFFGIVLGVAGLGSAWRAAHQVWHLPAMVGEALMALATMIWALLLLLFILRWILARDESLGEAHHPVQWCFIGLAGVSAIAIESVLLHRLYTVTTLPIALRPKLGIQLAPPTVGAVAYLSINGGVPDMVAHVLVGYGLLMALLLLRLLPWIMEQPFSVSYWGFTFGATALAIAPIRMAGHGDTGAVSLLAPYLFAGANIVVGLVFVATLHLIIQGRLLPQAAPATPPQGVPV